MRRVYMSKFNIKIFTLFPEMIRGVLDTSVVGRSLEKGIWSLDVINIRDYAKNKYRTVDDTPYGGGAGMVMKADAIADAIDANLSKADLGGGVGIGAKTKLIYMSPRGRVFKQGMVREMIDYENIAIICGRFEGIDQRFLDEYNVEEVSIGDYVLTGGELPAMVMVDACVRCLSGVLGNDESASEDSFGGLGGGKYENLLEYNHYTKPSEWRGRSVPEVLLSGNHKKIEEWRLENAKEITKKRKGLK